MSPEDEIFFLKKRVRLLEDFQNFLLDYIHYKIDVSTEYNANIDKTTITPVNIKKYLISNSKNRKED